ncbi:hypothetical protein D3C80_130240 [compost metagenome]
MADNDFFDTRAKTYVKFVLDEMKVSPSKLAKMAGLSPTTLTRALNDPTHKFTLSMSTIGKIYKASGINFHPFFESGDFVELSMAPYDRQDFYDEETWGEGSNIVREEPPVEGSTAVIGEAIAGTYTYPRIASVGEFGALWLRVPRSTQSNSFAVRAGDNNMAPYIKPGEYAVCLRVTEDKSVLTHGSMVVVERWTASPRLMELTLRRLVMPENARPYLKYENTIDPKEDLVEISEDLSNTDDLKIIGVVLYAVRYVDNTVMREEDYERRVERYRRSLLRK